MKPLGSIGYYIESIDTALCTGDFEKLSKLCAISFHPERGYVRITIRMYRAILSYYRVKGVIPAHAQGEL